MRSYNKNPDHWKGVNQPTIHVSVVYVNTDAPEHANKILDADSLSDEERLEQFERDDHKIIVINLKDLGYNSIKQWYIDRPKEFRDVIIQQRVSELFLKKYDRDIFRELMIQVLDQDVKLTIYIFCNSTEYDHELGEAVGPTGKFHDMNGVELFPGDNVLFMVPDSNYDLIEGTVKEIFDLPEKPRPGINQTILVIDSTVFDFDNGYHTVTHPSQVYKIQYNDRTN